jgi:hypothetical protein
MVQPYPSGGGQVPEPQKPAPPASVHYAVRLMYAGAVLSVVVLLAALITIGSVRTAVHHAYPGYSASRVRSAALVVVVTDVILQVITVGLWLWMARANRAGNSWARIVASVLFGLNTIFLLLSFARPHASIGAVLNLLIWLVGLGAIVLLWRRDSTDYITATQRP